MDVLDLSNKNEEEKKARSEELMRTLRLYLVPLASVGVFLISVFVFLIPLVGSIFDDLSSIETLRTEREVLREELANVQILNNSLSQIQSDLAILDAVAPTGDTELVNFRNRVTELANSNNLEIISQSLRESSQSDEDQADATTIIIQQPGLSIQELPVSYRLRGSFSDIENFVVDLGTLDDFVIVKDLGLTLTDGSNDIWDFELEFVKYQFNSGDDASSLYSSIAPTVRIPTVIQEYLDSKR